MKFQCRKKEMKKNTKIAPPSTIPVISKPFPLSLYSPFFILIKSMLPQTTAAMGKPKNTDKTIGSNWNKM